MKSLLSLLLLSVSPVFAADEAPATAPSSPDAWAHRMMNPTQNASAFKDPAAFMAWTQAMADPATGKALLKQGMDSATYISMAGGMMNPATMQNYMQFADPGLATKWMGAGMDPRFLNGMLGMGMNPGMYGNWMAAPMNPQMWAPAMQMLQPTTMGNMMMAPLSPAAMNTMMLPMSPQTYMQWMNAGINPATYGGMGQMLNPAALMRLMPAMPAAPVEKADK